MDFVIRPLTSADEPLLWEALSQALHRSESETAPSHDLVHRPEFARFVEHWGREGDAGFVAHDVRGGGTLGAVWFRPPPEGATPELAFAVKPEHRKHGIGAALLTQWVRANPGQSVVSLRAGPHHPAVRLYERFGFRVTEESGTHVTLRRDA